MQNVNLKTDLSKKQSNNGENNTAFYSSVVIVSALVVLGGVFACRKIFSKWFQLFKQFIFKIK